MSGKGAGQAKRKQPKPLATDLDELFAQLRSGAANVAGVTYQVALSAMLLAAGRTGTVPGLPVTAVIPESLEDIDCQLVDGSRLLVQSKERGPGAAKIAAAELAGILAHAALGVKLSDEAAKAGPGATGPGTRLAVVTNGSFGSSLPLTGWTQTLDAALSVLPTGSAVRQTLLTALKAQLKGADLDEGLAPMVVARTHLVHQDAPGQAAVAHLLAGLGLHPALAVRLRRELQDNLAQVATYQRQATRATVSVRTIADLDAMAARLAREVSVDALDEAVKAGVCEPVDFLAPSPQDVRGFYEGVSVLPSHIAAGLDVVRPAESQAVLNALASRGQVVIAGPSGSGKSALLWRCARLIEAGPQLLRVLRVETSSDAELLFRHVQRAQPTEQNQVVVCIDDLGRARTGAWTEARDRLLGLPGVKIMAAARQEDLTASLSRGAVIVDARLTPSAAAEVHHAVCASGVSVEMAREEAVARADGLLMEFLALVTTGRRLREVLAEQVDRLDEEQRQVDRELLRLICATHALGFETLSDTVPTALGRSAGEVESALRRLLGEHLITHIGVGGLRGLHDLRTEVLLELLHEQGHPALGATFAAAVMALGPAARPLALRRAAMRVTKSCGPVVNPLTAEGRLTQLHYVLRPLTECIGEQLRGLAGPGPVDGAAARAAALLEVADGIDTLAHVYACLPVADAVRPAQVDRVELLWLAWLATDGMDISNLPGPNILDVLVPLLPARKPQAAPAAGRALGADGLMRLLCGAPIKDAVRLAEAAETLICLSHDQAGAAYRDRIPALPDPPGSDPGVAADLRARFTASLAVLADLRGPAVAEVFGDVEARAADAVASNYLGYSVEVSLTSVRQLRARGGSSLARAWTYSPDQACAARVISYALMGDEPSAESVYMPEPGADPRSENSQIVLLMRRVFDACPEIDVIHAELWHANGRPMMFEQMTDGVKNILAGVLRRGPQTAPNVALHAMAVEAEGTGSWTRRCRAQAELSRDLLNLFDKLPSRLRSRDTVPARQMWMTQVQRAHEAATALPPQPSELTTPLSPAEAESLAFTATGEDHAVLDTARQDLAKKALVKLASCLNQVAHSPGNLQGLRGAGARLSDTVADLESAITRGAPVYSGIGDTLPAELVTVVRHAARLLSAVDEPPVSAALGRGASDHAKLDAAVDAALRNVLDRALQAATRVLRDAGVFPASTGFADETAPPAAWLDRQVAIAVPFEQWLVACEALRGWTDEQRQEAGLRCRVALVPVEDGEALPVGIHTSQFGPALPLLPDAVPRLLDALSLPLRGRATQAALEEPAKALHAYSYDLVRRAHRPPDWATNPDRPQAPDRVAEAVAHDQAAVLALQDHPEQLTPGDQAHLIAVQTLLEVCALVADEDGQGSGLAVGFADLDTTKLQIPPECHAAAKLNFALTAAIEADKAQPLAPPVTRP
ncbi:hypothetical protein ACFV0O_13280 [Kitasatospora sp. NPDC059577]|uniref:hypothetical protein n=1 Tax=Kitasatospora sp. NPDC059577 TaxID=3346873 RepID=UPI003676D12B